MYFRFFIGRPDAFLILIPAAESSVSAESAAIRLVYTEVRISEGQQAPISLSFIENVPNLAFRFSRAADLEANMKWKDDNKQISL